MSDRPTPLRLYYGDILRIVAALAVVALHVTAGGLNALAEQPNATWWACNLVDSACRWAVPVFVMLSGALLLDPAREERPGIFYRKRFARLGVPLLFWSLAYLLWWRWRIDGGFHPLAFAKFAIYQIGLAEPYYHLYFLFILLGLYAITPLLRVLVRHADRGMLIWYGALALLLASGDDLMRSHDGYVLNAFSFFAPYTGYFLLGFCLRDVKLDATAQTVCHVLWLICVAIVALGTAFSMRHWHDVLMHVYFLSYLNPAVIVMSICTFLLFAANGECFRNLDGNRTLRACANATLGVYLIHPAFVQLMDKHFLPPWPLAVYIVVQFVAITVLSFLVTIVVQRIPVLKSVMG